MSSKWYIFILSLSVLGCYIPADYDIPLPPEKLVFFADLTPDSLVKASLTKIRALGTTAGSPEEEFVKHGEINIFHDGQLATTLSYISPSESGDPIPVYSNNNFTVQTEKTYELSINVEGIDQVTAQCVIPKPVEITDVQIDKMDTTHIWGKDISYQIITMVGSLKIKDDVETTNYYHLAEADVYYDLLAGVNGDTIQHVPLTSEAAAFIHLKHNPGFLVLDHWLESTSSIPFRVSFSWIKDENSVKQIKFNVRHCDKAYFDFHLSWALQQDDISAFAPVVPVKTNIDDGLGYFSGFSVSQAEIEF